MSPAGPEGGQQEVLGAPGPGGAPGRTGWHGRQDPSRGVPGDQPGPGAPAQGAWWQWAVGHPSPCPWLSSLTSAPLAPHPQLPPLAPHRQLPTLGSLPTPCALFHTTARIAVLSYHRRSPRKTRRTSSSTTRSSSSLPRRQRRRRGAAGTWRTRSAWRPCRPGTRRGAWARSRRRTPRLSTRRCSTATATCRTMWRRGGPCRPSTTTATRRTTTSRPRRRAEGVQL